MEIWKDKKIYECDKKIQSCTKQNIRVQKKKEKFLINRTIKKYTKWKTKDNKSRAEKQYPI